MKFYFDLAQFYRISLGWMKPKVGLFDEVSSYFIVWPWLTEFFRTLQASEFTQFTDVARWELACRTGFFTAIAKNRAWAVVAGQKIIYRRPIPLFAKVRVTSQFVGTEGIWLYVSHRFYSGGNVCALSFVRLSIRNRKGPLKACLLFGEHSLNREPPPDVKALFESDARLLDLSS